jgi:hypothetical protein
MRYVILVLACALAASCGNPFELQAYILNVTDTVSLYSLSGTPVWLPSGYSIAARQAVRTESAPALDFAFDIDTSGRAVLLPTGAMKLGRQSGTLLSAQQFDSIQFAPTGNYNLDSAQVVTENTVLILRSTPVSCTIGVTSYYYAKLHVLTIDTTSAPTGRRLDFEILTNRNCGFRGLQPGLPKH